MSKNDKLIKNISDLRPIEGRRRALLPVGRPHVR